MNDLGRQSMGGPAKGTVWSNEVITPVARFRIKMKPGNLYSDQIRNEPKPPSRDNRSRAPATVSSRSNVRGIRASMVTVSELKLRPDGAKRSSRTLVGRGW